MPAIGFKCPNGDKVTFEQCFAGCDHQCMSLPALKATSQPHWFGKPSVTQLLAPTRIMYLQIMNDFYLNPHGSIAAMIGTSMHAIMEDNCPDGWIMEKRLEDDITSGAFDAYDATTKTLYDFKNYGAFKVSQVLGYKARWVKRTVTRGKHAGEERWEQKFEPGGVRHVHDVALQMNYYRILMGKHGYPVEKMMVQVFVRGGLDKTAKSYGITQPTYLVPINPISDHWVRMYFEMKYRKLMDAVESGVMPEVCKPVERWNDRRCKDFCEVNELCPYYQQNYMV